MVGTVRELLLIKRKNKAVIGLVNVNNMSKIKVKLEMTSCIKCGGQMPLLRLVKYGYKSCVNCSSVERVGGIPITNHKTGNTIQVVPMDVADNINRLAQRSGYGVCKGMKHN